jgi:hypothetical protein
MKIFSMAFQSMVDPSKFAMYSVMAPDAETAYKIGVTRLIADQGDKAWTPLMQTSVNIEIQSKEPKADTTDNKVDITSTKSWMMKTIIENNDTALYEAGKKYLSKPEQLFIEEKIHAK